MKTIGDDPLYFELVSGGAGLGITKREYFAGLALQAILSNIRAWEDMDLADMSFAGVAVNHADELIGALNAEEE
jgi:hypothetical protein